MDFHKEPGTWVFGSGDEKRSKMILYGRLTDGLCEGHWRRIEFSFKYKFEIPEAQVMKISKYFDR